MGAEVAAKPRMLGDPTALEENKANFLRELKKYGTVGSALDATGIPERTAYSWREKDEFFAAEWESAVAYVGDKLETKACKMALKGNVPLLTLLLKAHKPERFRERTDVTSGGAPLRLVLDAGPIADPPMTEIDAVHI